MNKELILRTLTGILFVATLVVCTLASPLTFIALFAVISGATTWEFCTNVNAHYGATVNRFIASAASMYLFVAFAAFSADFQPAKVFIPYLLTLIYLLISELYLRADDALKAWSLAFASQLYVALPFALLNVLAFQYDPMKNCTLFQGFIPLSVFVFLWVSDTGAYCCGSLFGRRLPKKLFERISPKKTWVGSIGGGLLCIVAALLFAHYVGFYTTKAWVGLSLTVCVFGTWGDLVESLFKRQLGVKDSGHVLPGHGGLLDRFDSSLLAVPAAVLYLYTMLG